VDVDVDVNVDEDLRVEDVQAVKVETLPLGKHE